MEEKTRSFDVNYLKVSQPIGDFYIASIPAQQLVDITDFDVRRVLMEERDVERYLGIQRPLNKNRVKEITNYVGTLDACFPTGIIIAIPNRCIELNEDTSVMTIKNYVDDVDDIDEEDNVIYKRIARVLDGQHRLAGLKGVKETFEVNVSIFVDIDIADQGNIFSTVNLAQTKVNKSLAYDLYDLTKSRSPQKTCHIITVTLDRDPDSPFYKMIKRLGVATPGRSEETLTQATFIQPLLKMISADPMKDRDRYLRKKKPSKIDPKLLSRHPFQHMFVDEKDFEITDIVWNYFSAVKGKWSTAWASRDKGVMLNKTNGYRALMRYLLFLYNNKFNPGKVPTTEDFKTVLDDITIKDADFNVENFAPGSSGESLLFKTLTEQTKINQPMDKKN
ncbi:DGQHR domain-containing protein [Deltaproteobacteria bacterium IMCC39524]|nr:DGQHR domain-containing protein [Deltaproteobacteria bacterium IMCC39524]